jgi:hypothetical protein
VVATARKVTVLTARGRILRRLVIEADNADPALPGRFGLPEHI